MKRLISLIVAFCFLITLFPPDAIKVAAATPDSTPEYTWAELQQMPSEPALEFAFLPAGARWKHLVATEEPAEFNVTYQLADNVVRVHKTVTDNIADMGQILSGSPVQKMQPNRIIEKGGYVPRTILDAAAAQDSQSIQNGTVVVDEDTGTAFKVVSPTVYSGIFDSDPDLRAALQPLENTYSITRPELHDVIKDFNMTEKTVTLNRANITGFAPNVEDSLKLFHTLPLSVGDEDKGFKTLTGDNLIELDFKDTALQGKVGSSTINVTLSGGLAIGSVDVTGRYSGMGGYEISMTLQEESYLVTQLDAEINQEIKVPILGIEVPFGVGEVYGGIFAIIGMDGNIRLGIEARETEACKMGIEGGTFLYVPTSFHPIFEPETPKITGDCSLLGKINGYIKFGPMLGIEIFGFDLVGAGVLIGAGVNVQSDGSMMNVELYGSIDVYVELADEYFSLARARPTIFKKQQQDMHCYKVSFLETFVNPGRVGGLIEQEPPQSGGDYVPSVGLEYRVWIIPQIEVDSFNADQRDSILAADRVNLQKSLKDKVRTYPENSFDVTNAEGEFIQKNDAICYDGDRIYLEFKGDGTTLFVGPATPVLPFNDVTITYADYFNDFITGKVEPKRMIIWGSNRFDPSQEQQELVYYQGPITISPFNDYGVDRHQIPTSQSYSSTHRPYTINGTAHTDTNALGEFDTRNFYSLGGMHFPSGTIDVLSEDSLNPYFPPATPPGTIGVLASINTNGATNNITVYGITPVAPDFQITRTVESVDGSYQRFNEGDKVVDRMAYDENLWISNPGGTRTITANMLEYTVKGFSTQDYKGYSENPVQETREGPITLKPVLDKNDNPTGTALFSQRITVEWVWQPHPDPIRITSPDQTQATAGEASSFQVTAEGFLPRFSLQGEPERVWIDEKTGLLSIPQTLSPGVYTFAIHAEEESVLTPLGLPDPKHGNDSSKPDDQVFTLTVIENPSLPSPSPTPEPSPTPDSEAETAPVIQVDEYNTYFTLETGSELEIPFAADGSKPITWSLAAVKKHVVPDDITINSETGVVTIGDNLDAGTYYFIVQAANTAGSDTHECTLKVSEPLVAPEISGDKSLTMTSGSEDLTAEFTATGSQPVTFSVKASSADGASVDEVSIDPDTGLLTVSQDIAAGYYSIIITAKNEAGKDTFECELEVAAPEDRTAPVLGNRRDGYQFTMSQADTDFAVQLQASGSTPITYSLEPVNRRSSVPDEISISANTGLLTVQGGLIGGISPGSYSFIVQASNAVGSDTQECSLEVTTALTPTLSSITHDWAISPGNSPNFVPVDLFSGSQDSPPLEVLNTDPFQKAAPQSKLTLRCDDPKDVYTHDRNIYNGACFICWDTSIKLSLINVMVDLSLAKVYSDYTYYDIVTWGDEFNITDNSPVCDRYHYYDPDPLVSKLPLSEAEKAEIKANIQKITHEAITEYQNGYQTVNPGLSSGSLRDQYYNFIIHPVDKVASSLEYGPLLLDLNNRKGGDYTVDLDQTTGTVITGQYFTSLLNNPQASLSFQQDGAKITFAGQDITHADDSDMFNIGLTYAAHEAVMQENLGSGAESFTYAFQHHGDLPGMATFAVSTSLGEGKTVNVYKFDAAANQFTLVAGNLKVGQNGVVTYHNNTMSEYVITTQTIPGAVVSDTASRQKSVQPVSWWLVGAISVLILIIIAVFCFFLFKRKRARSSQ